MIYTIGKRSIYLRGIADRGDDFQKMGKCALSSHEEYAGGSVWRTEEAALLYLTEKAKDLPGYDIFGLDADWIADTEQRIGEPFRRLLKNSSIVSWRRI